MENSVCCQVRWPLTRSRPVTAWRSVRIRPGAVAQRQHRPGEGVHAPGGVVAGARLPGLGGARPVAHGGQRGGGADGDPAHLGHQVGEGAVGGEGEEPGLLPIAGPPGGEDLEAGAEAGGVGEPTALEQGGRRLEGAGEPGGPEAVVEDELLGLPGEGQRHLGADGQLHPRAPGLGAEGVRRPGVGVHRDPGLDLGHHRGGEEEAQDEGHGYSTRTVSRGRRT